MYDFDVKLLNIERILFSCHYVYTVQCKHRQLKIKICLILNWESMMAEFVFLFVKHFVHALHKHENQTFLTYNKSFDNNYIIRVHSAKTETSMIICFNRYE